MRYLFLFIFLFCNIISQASIDDSIINKTDSIISSTDTLTITSDFILTYNDSLITYTDTSITYIDSVTSSYDSIITYTDSQFIYTDSLIAFTDSIYIYTDSISRITDSIITSTELFINYTDSVNTIIDSLIESFDSVFVYTDSVIINSDSIITYTDSVIINSDSIIDYTYTTTIYSHSINTTFDSIIIVADSFINAKQYQSAFQLLNNANLMHVNPIYSLKLIELASNYYLVNTENRLFAFKNLSEDEDLLSLRENAVGSYQVMNLLEIDSILLKFIERYPDSYLFYKTLAYYFHDTYLHFGETQQYSGDDLLELANTYYAIATDNGINNPEAYYLMGYYQLYYEAYQTAIPLFLKAIEYNTENPSAYYNLALCYYFSEDTVNIIPYTTKALSMYTDSSLKADVARLVGIDFLVKGNYAGALIYYNLSDNLDPYNYNTLKQKIETLLLLSQPDEVLESVKRFFSIDPTNPTLPQDLIDIYTITRYGDLLPAIFDILITEYYKNSEIAGNLYFHKALYYYNIEDYKKAGLIFNNAKERFHMVLPKTHYVFYEIERIQLEMKKK